MAVSQPLTTSEFLPVTSLQRWAGFGLIAVEAAVMAVAWRTSFLPILGAGGALLGVFLKKRFTWSRDQWAVVVVVLAVFCGVHQYVAPFDVDREPMVFPPSMALPTTEFILLIQVVAFFRRSVEDRLPAFLPGAGAIYLTIVTDVMPGESAQRTLLLALVTAFIASASMFLILRSTSARAGERIVRRRTGATIVAVSAVAGITWISASLLYGFGGRIDTFLAESWFRRMVGVDLGFSSVARLGTVARCKSFRSDSVALRIASNDHPGYLRGKVFDDFHNSDWMSVSGGVLIQPTDKLLAGMTPPLPGEYLFPLQDGRNPSRCVDVTWSQKDLGELLFAPLGAVAVKTSTNTVSVNRHDVAQTVNNLLETPYQVAVSDERLRDALTPELKTRLLAIPRTLDPRIRALATRLFASRATQEARIAAVQAFFRDNFQYSLEIEIPHGKEPLAFFLFENRSGDCEYFATAAVMLLRLGGIPCRYVTGFVPSEHNDYNGTWIARNKDAHAWVEAYVEHKGWTTIEATPESGIPQLHETASLAARIWEAVTSSLRDVTFRTRRLGFLYLLKSVLSNRLLVLCLAILVAWSGMRIARDRRAKRTIDSESPHQKELRRLLKLLDKAAARHQFVRRASETIGQFADRIDRAPDLSVSERPFAQVYRQYAAIRFDRDRTEEKLAELCASVKDTLRSPNSRFA
jgi:protein-glutamine gamma-glutamyltransferase